MKITHRPIYNSWTHYVNMHMCKVMGVLLGLSTCGVSGRCVNQFTWNSQSAYTQHMDYKWVMHTSFLGQYQKTHRCVVAIYQLTMLNNSDACMFGISLHFTHTKRKRSVFPCSKLRLIGLPMFCCLNIVIKTDGFSLFSWHCSRVTVSCHLLTALTQ